ncbi:S8 family serine peptidase [Chryseobacterium sp. 2987]|uniref:S8 family serine peptidase n=1 Tax=Chryseobacterium sp. 2987 TaxID=2817767 RepID=UPI0028557DB3|nr:S8 family serine peptidase [Chryseobacterium sp. 2987]MDR6922398.1 subtilisin family serine protease [Chryseobacterium sp. 2987]
MKNKVLIAAFSLWSALSFAQNKAYYIEIANNDNVPKIKSNGKNLFLEHTDRSVTQVLSKYEIYKFEKAFPLAVTPFLQRIYLLEVNKSEVFEDLKQFSRYFPLIEETRKPEILYTPNDYHYPIGSSAPRKSLDLINITNAWDYTHGDPNIKIGICDTPIRLTHEDLVGKVTSLDTYTYPDSHGTAVASHAAANTDNGKGIPGTGFNSTVLYKMNNSVNGLLELSKKGARVVNASWHNGYCAPSTIEQSVIDEIYANGTVVIAAAGNSSTCGGPFTYVYPASYNHVISVSTVGHEDVGFTYNNIPMIWKDRVEHNIGDPATINRVNDKVDVYASGYNVLGATAESDTSYGGAWGTSLSAPQISGVVALLFSANNCLNADEVESILKLGASDLDTIPENLPYVGRMGAGRIDAGKSTKLAWQMNPVNGGEMLVSGRDFNRYSFELINSPQKVRIKDQSFVNQSEITIKAKDYILLENNVVLAPDPGKSNYLYIGDNSCYTFAPVATKASETERNSKLSDVQIAESNLLAVEVYPNPSSGLIYFKNLEKISAGEKISVAVYDLSGRLVINKPNLSVLGIVRNGFDISELKQGSYLVELSSGKEKVNKKIIKK